MAFNPIDVFLLAVELLNFLKALECSRQPNHNLKAVSNLHFFLVKLCES